MSDFQYVNKKRWDKYAHQCPFAADIESGHVPPLALAIAPSIALDLPGGITRFRFTKRSDRDKFAAAWRSAGHIVKNRRSLP